MLETVGEWKQNKEARPETEYLTQVNVNSPEFMDISGDLDCYNQVPLSSNSRSVIESTKKKRQSLRSTRRQEIT